MEEHLETAKDKRNVYLILTLAGTTLAVCAGVAAMMAGFGSRIGLWHFRTGFVVLHWAFYAGVAAVIASIAGPLLSRVGKAKCLAAAIPGLLIGVALIVILVNVRMKAANVPPIHDITTDIVNPPKFVAVEPLRTDADNPVIYRGPEVAIKQLQAYPDIKPLVLEIPSDRAYDVALLTARGMGWEIVSADKATGRIEATDTTFWFGFKDDIVIRVTAADQRSIIDIRSLSRVGRSDLGTNAERIRSFMKRVGRNP